MGGGVFRVKQYGFENVIYNKICNYVMLNFLSTYTQLNIYVLNYYNASLVIAVTSSRLVSEYRENYLYSVGQNRLRWYSWQHPR